MADPMRPAAEKPLAARLNYAQCWEDERVLVEALRPAADEDVLSIGSAGDNTIALALAGARSVTAVDLSEPQLALLELKLAGARLHYLEYRQLLGLDTPGRRVFLYHQVRDALSDRARRYWNAHEHVVREGILGSGRFERYLSAFRERVLPLVHRRETVRGWFDLPDVEAQRAYYERSWDTWRWRTLFRLFFSRPVMAARGRSPEQFAHVEGPVASVLLGRARRVLTGLPLADNGYVQWMLLGERVRDEAWPAYLRPEGFRRLGEVADRIRLVHGPIQQALARGGSWSAFNLSDVPEYLSEAEHTALYQAIVGAAAPGARVAYWNLFVPRQRPDALAERVEARTVEAAALHARDRAFVYGAFRLEVVR